MNDKFLQISGPFKQGEDIIAKIKEKYNSNFRYIKKLGIQSKITNICIINGVDFEIGKTEILEFNDAQIISLSFKQDEFDSTIIDCIVE